MFFSIRHSGHVCLLIVTGLTLSIAFALFITALKSIFSYVIVPICAVPLLRDTEFCSIVVARGFQEALNTKSKTAITITCGIPGAARFPFCSEHLRKTSDGGSTLSPNPLSSSLDGQFAAYKQLVASSTSTPVYGREIRDIVLSLDDMSILLKGSSFKNKEAILSHLGAIRLAARESARRLQKYTAKLLSSITLYVTIRYATIFLYAENHIEYLQLLNSQ